MILHSRTSADYALLHSPTHITDRCINVHGKPLNNDVMKSCGARTWCDSVARARTQIQLPSSTLRPFPLLVCCADLVAARGGTGGELQGPKQVRGIGYRHRRHGLFLAQRDKVFNLNRPFGQRIGGVHP